MVAGRRMAQSIPIQKTLSSFKIIRNPAVTNLRGQYTSYKTTEGRRALSWDKIDMSRVSSD
jgi:hypothetical protein